MQKRVGKRLRKLKKTEKGLGRLGLNDATIDKLQNYYGIAVRSNLKSVEDMKRGIYATWCHVAFIIIFQMVRKVGVCTKEILPMI